jgi:hypothetical protein
MIPLLDNLVEHQTRSDPKRELTIQEVRFVVGMVPLRGTEVM